MASPRRPADPLATFTSAARDWFASSFEAPTDAQAHGWPAISAGEHALICAPTGSGKTLAAFLWCVDRLISERLPDDPMRRLRVLYVSPLKALVHDVDRNLRAPLAGIRLAAERRGEPAREVSVGMRTGDTPADQRRAFGRRPPDILVTTPESLYLLLTSAAREALRGVEWIILDEIHALAGTKRGAHLALSLERLEALTERPPQRIGLSATQRPLEVVAGYLGGRDGSGAAAEVAGHDLERSLGG
ncbi:MAG TPA: DEAD/DEAH box helicase, partial [Candidatus Limnocylindria bacterium]|nr:DEAD/DEAH box helicase [Candidatus Limnocylindria bacterium]